MKDINYYGNMCIENLNAIGIYPNEISEFKINSRAKSRWGQAKKTSGIYTIEISSTLLNDKCKESALLETMYHELLHCVKGCMNHGEKWQSLADLVSDCYNVNITRCSSSEKKLGKEYAKEIEKNKNEYKVRCLKCGTVTKRMGYRAPKWYMHPNYFHCAKCKGSLERI